MTFDPSLSRRIPEQFQSGSGKNQTILFSLVIPTYNEADSIKALVNDLVMLLDPVLPEAYELIVVDDNSPDRTWELAARLQYPQLRVIRRQQERGLSTAVIHGWQVARGKILGVIDGDLQHPPEVLLALLDRIRVGADLAIASRHIDGGGVSSWSLERRIISRGAQIIGLLLLPEIVGRVSDPLSGYFLVRRRAIVGRDFNPLGYKILLEVLGRGSIAQISEVGYVFQERQQGQSKVNWPIYLDYLQHLLRLRLSLWPVGRFLQFGLVGASGVLVDMSLLYLLHDPLTLNLGLIASKLLASEFAIINNFFWNDLWTFRDIAAQQPGFRNRLRRLIKFNVICLLGLSLNSFALIALTKWLGIHYLVANLIAISLVLFWNFSMNLKLSWRVTGVDRST